jgi:hypothetical protein
MAEKFEAYLEYPLSYAELVEIMTALNSRLEGLKEGVTDDSQFEVSENRVKVKIANIELAISKLQRLLWKVQSE